MKVKMAQKYPKRQGKQYEKQRLIIRSKGFYFFYVCCLKNIRLNVILSHVPQERIVVQQLYLPAARFYSGVFGVNLIKFNSKYT